MVELKTQDSEVDNDRADEERTLENVVEVDRVSVNNAVGVLEDSSLRVSDFEEETLSTIE